MRTQRTSCRRSRRGIASILGTIIFVAIMFSTFIPMYLVMKQAESIYDRDMLEAKRLDDERDREAIYVYAYPKGTSSDQVEVKVENIGAVIVDIARIWVNDTMLNQSVTIASMDEAFLGPFTLSIGAGANNSYAIRVVTERGKRARAGQRRGRLGNVENTIHVSG